ncbi:MAG: iron hydrogenase [Pelosinus sp.]|nr:iron hydrogenase [Pelosinus sp.]
MSVTESSSINIKPRILYQVAKAAWEGNLFERRQEICQMVYKEAKDPENRRYIANQIRLAMGLEPHESEEVFSIYDKEVLMGLSESQDSCPLAVITQDEYKKEEIDQTKCTDTGQCFSTCSFGVLGEKAQFVPLLKLLKEQSAPVYASVAPAFAGQFGTAVTAGRLRSALLKLGFADMVETALYADIITMKEAFEFDEHVQTENDFMITSCCCPVWIKLIENKFPELVSHISPSVSPMIASARIIKALEPAAKVVFIGPCVAKKSEAQLPELKGAVDYVLTFQELSDIFEAAKIDPAEQPDEENPAASWCGRVYGHTGGVSSAVGATLARLVPRRSQGFKPLQVDGVIACQNLLEKIKNGENINANFIEGMACKGGCVGGPGRIIDPNNAAREVDAYASSAPAHTPVENAKIYALLNQLGHSTEPITLTGHSPIAAILAREITK